VLGLMSLANLSVYDYAMFGYFAAFIVYALHLFWFRRPRIGALAAGILWLAWVLHTVFLVQRALFYNEQHQGFVLPATNMYEAISFFTWLVVLLYLVAEFFLKTRVFGVLAMIVPVAAMAYIAAGISADPRELMPALKSYWLVFHICAMFIGYAALAIAFSFAILYLVTARRGHWLRALGPRYNLAFIDQVGYRMVLLGFPMITIGIFLGAVWADSAWGRYWGWDPKETWALITWFIYLAYLHLRMHWRWAGYRSALFNIIGFISVLITFVGVNLLDSVFHLNSIHAYAEGGGVFMLVMLGLALLIPIVLYFLPAPAEQREDPASELAGFRLAAESVHDSGEGREG
jgi:cytochrome c-type biogenesis protein CcsB